MNNSVVQRSQIIRLIIIGAAAVLAIKVATLQVFDQTYRQQAEARTFDKQTLYPSRGLIYDRAGKLLVYNNPIYDITAVYNNVSPDTDTSKLCSLLGIDNQTYHANLDKPWGARYSRSVPFTFMRNVSPVTFASLQERLYEFSGFTPVLRNTRGYNYACGAHALGYISEVDQATVDASDDVYALGDYIGTTGIERRYESDLKGQKGVAYVLRDNLGRKVGSVQNGKLDSSAVSGIDIQLSLDIDLQQYGEVLMQGKKGSIVCIEPKTGEILSIVSAPGYDPADLTIHEGRSAAFSSLLKDTLNPFFDRSIMAEYAPGSIYKPVLALIAMQEGVLKPYRTIYCDGAYHYRHFSYGCHEHSTPTGVSTALQHSCNSYFFQVFRDLVEKEGFIRADRGLSRLNEYLRDFGLGSRLGIDLPQEKAGNVPSVSYYDNLYGKDVWRSTYILSLGIGQGETQLTTLQMANLAAIIANRGYYYTPHLIKRYVNDVRLIPENFRIRRTVPIDPQYFEPVVTGMARAVTSGTATSAYHPRIRICGKTGTAQNPHGEDHSVFFAFAPADDPQIAIAVYVENGGWGGTYAAPIASLMIEKYLEGQIAGNRLWIENRILETNLLSTP